MDLPDNHDDELEITWIPRDVQRSDFDWANIEHNRERVGKTRCLIEGDNLIIFSINIYPEYQGRGYGRKVIEYFQKRFPRIEADGVRWKAIGFWERMGFRSNNRGNWVFERT